MYHETGEKELITSVVSSSTELPVSYEIKIISVKDDGSVRGTCDRLYFRNSPRDKKLFTQEDSERQFISFEEVTSFKDEPNWLSGFPYYSFDKKTKRFIRNSDNE